MKSQENIDLQVTQDGLRFAGIYSLKIENANERRRAFASLVILSSLADFFMKQSLIVAGTKSLYKASKLSEEFEITDLYVNNWRLDIRLAMPGDFFYIPKSHFENEIQPDFYIVATIDKDLKKPEFFGYVSPKNLNKTSYNSLYYKANFDDLGEMSDLLQELRQQKGYYCKEKDHKFFHTKILSYFDNEADNFTKSKLLEHLLGCQNCRTELINFCGFDIISKKLEDYTDLFDDDSLNIIGALNAQDDEEEEEEGYREAPVSKEKQEQGELIDGLFDDIPKPAKPIDTKPFKNISEENIEVLPSTNKEKITLTEPDIFLQDVPPLGEVKEQPKTQIKLNKLNQEDNMPLTFTEDKEQTQQKISLSDSLHDIPDEMFNDDYEEKTPKKGGKAKTKNAPSSPQTGGERIIVDYDEFGQPVYAQSHPEDYKIVEDVPKDTFKKEGEEAQPDITDTFKKDEEQETYIEGSSETCNEELISNAPPQGKKKRKKNSFIPVIVGLFILFLISYFVFVNPIFKQEKAEPDIPSINPYSGEAEAETDIDDIISKNINSKTSFVKLKKINWVAQKSLLQDEGFKEYLQTVDKRFKIKFKLNSNSFTQAPFNNNVVVEIIVTPDGEIKSSRVASSSGIKKLDQAIVKSIKEATDMLPIPAKTQAKMQLSEYYIKIMIKL